MQQNGLAKLCEECGELSQVVGKMIQYPELQLKAGEHPDGTCLRDRLEQEMADVMAAIEFVQRKLKLSKAVIDTRAAIKLNMFEEWSRKA